MLLTAVTQSAEDKKDNEISLHKSALDTKQKRFASYYEQLKLWNENYDHLLSEIEYALDRPVFGQADRKNEDFRIYRAKIREIDCLNYSFSEELEKLHLNGNSLKLRFAVIHNCFMIINNALNKQMNEAISKTLPSFHDLTESIPHQRVHDVKPISLLRTPAHRLLQRAKRAGDLQRHLRLAMAQRCHDDSGAEAF